MSSAVDLNFARRCNRKHRLRVDMEVGKRINMSSRNLLVVSLMVICTYLITEMENFSLLCQLKHFG